MSQVAQQQSTTGLSSTGSWNGSSLIAATTAACSTNLSQFATHEQSVSSYCRPAVHSVSSRRANNTSRRSNTREPESCDSALKKEEERCKKFLADTCGCKMGVNKKPCSSQFKLEYLLEVRAQAALLTGDQLDMVILGGVMAGMNKGDDIYHGRHKPAKRQRIYTEHIHNGHAVCAVTFGFLHGIGMKHRLGALQKHYAENGISARVHKNTGRLPVNALSYDQQLNIVKFLENYAEANAILLPGRIPGYKRDDLKLLPSSCSKRVS